MFLYESPCLLKISAVLWVKKSNGIDCNCPETAEGNNLTAQETKAARQNFTSSEKGIINMKQIWQELR